MPACDSPMVFVYAVDDQVRLSIHHRRVLIFCTNPALLVLQMQGRGRGRSNRLDPVTPRIANSSKQQGNLEWRSPPGAGGESSSDHLSSQLAQPNLYKEGSCASTASATAQPVATSSMVEVGWMGWCCHPAAVCKIL